jgi:sialate O-acetylesterase
MERQQVKITGSWDNSTTTGIVSNLGKWNFKNKTPSAGGPFTIRINSAGEDIVLNDVMIARSGFARPIQHGMELS